MIINDKDWEIIDHIEGWMGRQEADVLASIAT
jgi:hypothetical protein